MQYCCSLGPAASLEVFGFEPKGYNQYQDLKDSEARSGPEHDALLPFLPRQLPIY